MDETWKLYAQWNKPDKMRNTYVKYLEYTNLYKDIKQKMLPKVVQRGEWKLLFNW